MQIFSEDKNRIYSRNEEIVCVLVEKQPRDGQNFDKWNNKMIWNLEHCISISWILRVLKETYQSTIQVSLEGPIKTITLLNLNTFTRSIFNSSRCKVSRQSQITWRFACLFFLKLPTHAYRKRPIADYF